MIKPMELSDLFTTVTILIAIFAIIPGKNRRLVFLKFSVLEKLFLAFIFIFINYLFAFDWFVEKIPFLSHFICEESIYPNIWAYLISLFTLIWIIWKMLWAYFPKRNRPKVITYYEYLLIKNIDFLAELIEQYHKNDIIQYLKATRNIEYPNILIEEIAMQVYNKRYNKATKSKHIKYGSSVWGRIVLNDVFIDSIVNKNPYFFSDIIQELNTTEAKNPDFVNHFLKILTRDKNSLFFREIRNNANEDELGGYRIEKERPILYALFHDAVIASLNEAWRGIGEQALLEMEKETTKTYSPLRSKENEQDEDTIWGYRITNAISYFDIMVRCAIIQHIKDHMWMFYYAYFLKCIIANMESLSSREADKNRITRNFHLIEIIFVNMMDWKKVCIESNNFHMITDICSCMGQCLVELAITDKLRDEDKKYLINWVWEDLLKTVSDKDDEENINNLIDSGFRMFKNPMPCLDKKEKLSYSTALNYMFDHQDKIGLNDYEDRVTRFEKEVLSNLFE